MVCVAADKCWFLCLPGLEVPMRSWVLPITFLALSACPEAEKDDIVRDTSSTVDTNIDTDTDDGTPVDLDGDGYPAAQDCDDNNAEVNPGAEEICDGADNDCDGSIDEGQPENAPTWYADADGDGYGDYTDVQMRCVQPHGYVAAGGDCDDTDALYNPSAQEADCTDPNDYNCDGSVGYADNDNDDFPACEDCDDSDGAINDNAPEICDGADNDCDGDVDDDDSSLEGAYTYYADADGDGVGGSQFSVDACQAPDGYVLTSDDCDDLNAQTYPGATEICDLEDNNCDSQIDEGLAQTWYADVDSDGYGDPGNGVSNCEAPVGFVSNSDDCNDLAPESHPGASEVCDLDDNDCDGTVDEGVGSTWYADSDNDGFGNGSVSTVSCEAPSGYVSNALDCDDYTSTTNPSSYEVCDGVDNDCDGTVDEGDAINATTWYSDADGDGYPDAVNGVSSCTQPSGAETSGTDCDDSDATVHPGAIEACDGVDNDCNGTADGADAVDASTYYQDADADGYGDANSTQDACSPPSGYVTDTTDCDDSSASAFPGAPDTWYDGVDSDCDGASDYDQDADGYDSDAFGGDDCDDTDSAINPGASEIVSDGIDQDCDGTDSTCTTLIVVEGTSGDINVCTTCATGDHSCQAQQICDFLTGETCQHQGYDCATGSLGSWYPPSHGGGSNFNFAYAYDIWSTDYGNICDCINVSSTYGIASNHDYCGTGRWFRQ